MFQNKKILILGFARSGYQAAKLLIKRGNEVYLNDSKDENMMDAQQVDELKNLGVHLIFGSHPDDLLNQTFDYLIKNPGVPIDHKYVLQARRLNIPVINEVEMAFQLLPNDVEIIGVTGTNGKTTTTTIIYEIMKKAFGSKVHLAGNIGYPLSSILDCVHSGDIIVMECSCQQGENFVDFHPHVGVVTNFSEAHIDFMKTYEHYKETKSRMFYKQGPDDIAIMNYDNVDVMNELNDIISKKKYFSSRIHVDGCHLEGNDIYYYDELIISIDDLKIKGMHNVENCMAAIMAVKEYDVDNEVINSVLSNFRGVEHRLEYVDTLNDVEFYNDTEATNIKCCQIALASFHKPTILFLGGLERGQNFEELTPYINNVKAIIAIGQCRDRVFSYAKSIGKDVYVYEYLNDGFDKAVQISAAGDVVLLSPASASWDQYKECEERGTEFKKKVIGLFDSGLGGLSILKELLKLLPNEDFLFYEDSLNNPYGDKTEEELLEITSRIVDYLLKENCKIIVIACNTATTSCIKKLRELYPNTIFVGTVPAIKVAYDCHFKHTLILSTPYTSKSTRVHELIHDYQDADQEIINVSGENLANLVEMNKTEEIDELLNKILSPYFGVVDSVVLGCTHYPLIKDRIEKILPNVALLDGSNGVAREVKHQLELHDLLKMDFSKGSLVIVNNKSDLLVERSYEILERV